MWLRWREWTGLLIAALLNLMIHASGQGPTRQKFKRTLKNMEESMENGDKEFIVSLRRERATSLLLPLFFISGATGLVYQTVWARQLHVLFGTSTFAVATVLAAFMLGLSAGGFWMAGRSDRIGHPLRWYGILEVVIGVYALIFPFIVSLISPIYLRAGEWLNVGPLGLGSVQLVLVGGALLVPTACMGATLPLLARYATQRLGAAGNRVGTLYGINTFGAVIGTWLCGFFLLPALGVQWNTWICAFANIILGFAAIRLDQWVSDSVLPPIESDLERPEFGNYFGPMCVVAFLMGFAALVYEVAWTRVLALMLGASVYAFSMMLLAFLLGIAGGGYIGGRLADGLMKKRVGAVIMGLAIIEVAVGCVAFSLHYLFPELPFWYVYLFDWFGGVGTPRVQWWASAVLSIAIMTPAALLMGMAFPMTIRATLTDPKRLGGVVGWIYGANTVGGTLGAALAGFVLLPQLNMVGTILLAVFVNFAAAIYLFVLLWHREGGRRYLLGALGTVALIAALFGMGVQTKSGKELDAHRLLMTAGMYKYVSQFDKHSRDGVMNYAVHSYDLLYYKEGMASVVTVGRNRDSGNLWLANNGKVEASTTVDMPTQVLVALLPFQYVAEPDDVLVVGLASGITAGAASLVPAIKELEIVELEPTILEAARFFDEQNHYVLDDPRTKIVMNDGRNHLLLAKPASYDVVVSEPSNPWISGVSNLFTREFWEMGKTRLKPGGVWSQWVQMYGMDDTDLRTLLATFAEVFPYVSLYMTVEDADLVLLGSDAPLSVHPDHAANMFARWPRVQEEFGEVKLGTALSVLSSWQMGRDQILEMTQGAWLNTDDNMSIEYRAPLNLHRRSTSEINVEMLLEFATLPPDGGLDAEAWFDLSAQYRARNDWERCIEAVFEAFTLMVNTDVDAQRLLAQARGLDEQEEWMQALAVLIRLANHLLDTQQAPLWLDYRWEDWRVETWKYLDGGEDSDVEEQPLRPNRLDAE